MWNEAVATYLEVISELSVERVRYPAENKSSASRMRDGHISAALVCLISYRLECTYESCENAYHRCQWNALVAGCAMGTCLCHKFKCRVVLLAINHFCCDIQWRSDVTDRWLHADTNYVCIKIYAAHTHIYTVIIMLMVMSGELMAKLTST
jgi:hypothetical protein